jgi:hypothetical protein
MTEHTVALEVYYNGAWNEVAAEALTGRKITIQRGLTEQGELRAAKVAWTFKDPADKWRPTNPESPLYGVAGRNMPVRVIVDGATRAYCEASSFQPEQEPGGPRLVHLSTEGLQRRVGLWTEKLRSPIYRQLSAQPAVGYWPLEDGSGATSATSAVAAAAAGFVTDVTFGEDDAPGGASASVVLRTVGTSRISAVTPQWTVGTDGWAVMFYCRLPAPVVGGIGFKLIDIWGYGTVRQWSIEMNDVAFTLRAYDANGAQLFQHGPATFQIDPTQWFAIQLETEQAGGNVNWALIRHQVGSGVFWSGTGSYAGTVERVTSTHLFPPVADTRVSHLWVGHHTLPFVDFTFMQVSAGYAGELAANRFLRLMGEAGLTAGFLGDIAGTMPMGPQRSDTLLELLKECARTDDALIYDSRQTVRLVFRTRVSLYTQTPALELTWPDDIAPPFAELIDDDGVYNRVTVSQRDGGEATAVAETGPLSIQPPPAGVGEYRRGIDVNVADEQVFPQLAAWCTAHGLGGRYPQVTIDLDAHPELTAAVHSVEIGARITIAGREPELISLIVLGIAETVETHRRLVTFTCIRDTVFQVGVYDDTDSRWDSRTTTVKTDVSSSATTITFRTTDPGDLWSTAGVPYDVLIAGQRNTVTAMGAASLVSGAYDQTATVTRGVNGVTKPLAAGDEIHVASPGRWAL